MCQAVGRILHIFTNPNVRGYNPRNGWAPAVDRRTAGAHLIENSALSSRSTYIQSLARLLITKVLPPLSNR